MMTRTKKRVLAAVAVSLGFAVAAPLVGPGVAHAQTGSRICGVKFEAEDGDAIWKIYEAPAFKETIWDPFSPANALNVCNIAKSGGASKKNPMDAPEELKAHLRGSKSNESFTSRIEISNHACEGITGEIAASGSPQFELGGDICKSMERSDGPADMEAYWLVRAGGSWFMGR